MADIENESLLRPGSAPELEPVSKKTKTLTYIVFGVSGFIAVLGLFNPGFIGRLAFYALALYLAFRIFNDKVMKCVASNSMGLDVGLAYLACGLIPMSFLYKFTSDLLFVLFLIIVTIIIFVSNPAWLTAIEEAITKLDSHGSIEVNGVPLVDTILKSSMHLLHTTKSSVLPYVFRLGVMKVPSSSGEKLVLDLKFADGTNAGPVIAGVVRAFGKIPIVLLLFLAVVNALLLKALLQEYFKLHLVNISMRREGTTFRSTTACAMAIGLGFSIMSYIVYPFGSFSNGLGGIIGGLFMGGVFVLLAAFQVSTAAMIGMQKWENDATIIEGEKKYVLALPVLLYGITYLMPDIAFVIFFKVMCNHLASLLEKGSIVLEELFGMAKWLPMFIVVLVAQIVLLVVAIRIASRRFNGKATIF